MCAHFSIHVHNACHESAAMCYLWPEIVQENSLFEDAPVWGKRILAAQPSFLIPPLFGKRMESILFVSDRTDFGWEHLNRGVTLYKGSITITITIFNWM